MNEVKWRDLALQFDGHRMEAISLLKMIINDAPDDKYLSVRNFLKATPLSGEDVLRNRIEEIAENMQQQLTATTNSLINAQEALKSAGIEADTVQAGVMGLVSRMNQVVAENAALKQVFVTREYSTEVTDVFSDTAVLKIDGDEHYCHQWVDNDSDVIRAVLTAINAENPTPATDAYLNAVRAEGADLCVKALVTSDDDDFSDAPNICGMVSAQLRAGNAGKDGSHE